MSRSFDGTIAASSSSASTTQLGRMTEENLRAHRDRDIVFSGAGDSIATTEEAAVLLSHRFENVLVAAAFSLLSKIFPDRELVSSELFPWLPVDVRDRSLNLKPDLFFCHRAHFDARVPAAGSRLPGVQYGVLADSRLCHDVWIVDCKVTMTNKAFGEAIVHLQYVAAHVDATFARGILFSSSQLWLLEVDTHGQVLRRIKLAWDQVRTRP